MPPSAAREEGPMHHAMRAAALLVVLGCLAACSVFGASEITILARNDSDHEMVVGVISGLSDDAAPHGGRQTLGPGEERAVSLAVPGGSWTVTVNGGRMVSSTDAGDRRGELPVTVILPNPEDFAVGPYWEAPVGWASSGP